MAIAGGQGGGPSGGQAAAAGGFFGLGLLGTAMDIKSQRFDEKVQRNILTFNEALLRQGAVLATKAAETRSKDIRRDTRSLVSTHRAAIGVSNLVTTSGSPLLAQLKQAEVGERAAQRTLAQGRVDSLSLTTKANLAAFEREVIRRRGKAQRRGMLLSGIAGSAQTGASFLV